MNITDILSDNRNVLNRHTRREARPGLWVLSMPGDVMPDGHEFEWQVHGEVTHSDLQEFCNKVREAYNERIIRQTDTKGEPSTARGTSSEGGGTNPGVGAGVVVSASPPVQDIEATLEDVLEAQVSKLRDRLDDVEGRITSLGIERATLKVELECCGRALAAYKGVPAMIKHKAKEKSG